MIKASRFMLARWTSYALLLLAVTVSLSAISATFARTWKSKNGAYTLDAEFIKPEGDKVLLRKPNGEVIKVPLSRLSDGDRAYVTKHTSADGTSSATSTATPTASKIRTFSQLLKVVKNLRNPSDVLRLYELFLQDQSIDQAERKAAAEQLPAWKKRAKDKMVRMGTRWLTPSEATEQKRQARQLVDEAIRLIEVEQHEAAVDKCLKASKLDQDDILADFVLGLGYALLKCDASKANRHFAECVQRDPRHISALNNLALSEVRLKRYKRALVHWQIALKLAPAAPEVIQNLGRLLYLAKQDVIHIPLAHERRFSDLYAGAAAAIDMKEFKFNRHTGWLYMQYYTPIGQQPLNNIKSIPHREKSAKRLMIVASGTGFVVHSGYILTNRHVVKGCSALTIVPPGTKGTELPANVVAVSSSPDDDLAVVRCIGLKAPPLPFIKEKYAKLGTEIMILGFPGMPQGKTPTLKSAHGFIAGLPDSSYNAYTMDALTNPGNSGGPVCDKKGNVLAIHFASTRGLSKEYALSIPHSHALPLMKKHIPGFLQLSPALTIKQWVDVVDIASRSTVLIWVKEHASHIGVPRKKKKSKLKTQAFEDPWCMTCYGRGTIDCPHCRKGQVSVRVTEIVPAPGEPYRVTSTIKVPCKKCHGKGVLDCPHCHGGRDNSLR